MKGDEVVVLVWRLVSAVAAIGDQVGGRLDFCGPGEDSFMVRVVALVVAIGC